MSQYRKYQSDRCDYYAEEIKADLMSVGYTYVTIFGRDTEIDWSDFLLFIDEQELWEELEPRKDELLDEFCHDYAEYRDEFLTN